MASDIVTQLERSAESMARGINSPAIGSDPLHYLNGQAAAEIKRLREVLMAIKNLTADQPQGMIHLMASGTLGRW